MGYGHFKIKKFYFLAAGEPDDELLLNDVRYGSLDKDMLAERLTPDEGGALSTSGLPSGDVR